MKDIVKYIFKYIPPFINHKGYYKEGGEGKKVQYREVTHSFKMFNNHKHYDFRICYAPAFDDDLYLCKKGESRKGFLYLAENIDTEEKLKKELRMLRKFLKENKLYKQNGNRK